MRKFFVLRPLTLTTSKRDLEASAFSRFKVAKVQKSSLFTCPDGDALAVLLDLGGGRLELGREIPQGGSLPLTQVRAPQNTVSLAGIARALILLRAKDRELYEAFVEAAKLLSLEVGDPNARIAPAQTFQMPTAKALLKKALARFALNWNDYFRAAGEVYSKMGLKSRLALFSPSPDEERKYYGELGVSPVKEVKPIGIDAEVAKEKFLSFLQEELEALEKKLFGGEG